MGVWIEMTTIFSAQLGPRVTPLVGVWIEIHATCKDAQVKGVTPLVGVWIEIRTYFRITPADKQSLPSWECGLKF